MAAYVWVKTGSRNGLLFECNRLPEPMLAYHQRYSLVFHYDDVITGTIASQITSLAIVYSIDYSSAHQRKHQSSASLVFVRGIHRGPVNSPHKWPVTRKMFPFDDVIMHLTTILQGVFMNLIGNWILEITNIFKLMPPIIPERVSLFFLV